jgi:leucine dehydrogenase
MFAEMHSAGAHRCLILSDEKSGLRAIVALDRLDLGPAVGGIRTRAYASDADACLDAARLARAMTLKCAIAGLRAGGGKTVVIDHPGLHRRDAFLRLGTYVEDLGGIYLCAGDLGTTHDDLLAMAEATRHVNLDEQQLSEAAGLGVLHCIEACAAVKGHSGIAGLTVAVQGCGAMGSAVARALASAGASLLLSDVSSERAEQLALATGGSVISPDRVLTADCDILSPCAGGGILDVETVNSIRAWAVCGAANNQLACEQAESVMGKRNVLYVPDFLASAGAVIMGVANHGDGPKLIGRIRETAEDVLIRSQREGLSATCVAEQKAREHIRIIGGSESCS